MEQAILSSIIALLLGLEAQSHTTDSPYRWRNFRRLPRAFPRLLTARGTDSLLEIPARNPGSAARLFQVQEALQIECGQAEFSPQSISFPINATLTGNPNLNFHGRLGEHE